MQGHGPSVLMQHPFPGRSSQPLRNDVRGGRHQRTAPFDAVDEVVALLYEGLGSEAEAEGGGGKASCGLWPLVVGGDGDT